MHVGQVGNPADFWHHDRKRHRAQSVRVSLLDSRIRGCGAHSCRSDVASLYRRSRASLTLSRRAARLIALTFALFAFSRTSYGQTNTIVTAGDRFFGAWIGFSPDSPVGSDLGTTQGRSLLLIGLRAEWVLETIGPFALAATSDLIPVAALSDNPRYRKDKFVLPNGAVVTVKSETGTSTVYGAGLSPLGLQLYLQRIRGINVFAGGAVGGLWFTRDTPVPDARRFNISFEYGGGLELYRPRRSIVIGYKFHHFSNAYSAPMNPGVDGNVFYIGLMERR
jgi:hypothetical protein